jgi:hypothetical protein
MEVIYAIPIICFCVLIIKMLSIAHGLSNARTTSNVSVSSINKDEDEDEDSRYYFINVICTNCHAIYILQEEKGIPIHGQLKSTTCYMCNVRGKYRPLTDAEINNYRHNT